MNSEQVFTGTGLSAGVAIGRPCFYRAPGSDRNPFPDSAPDQAARARKALFELTQYYNDLARQADSQLSQSAGDIFRAHAMMATDPSFMADLERKLAGGQTSAEAAVSDILDNFADQLQAATSENIRERVHDIIELKHVLLMYLDGKRDHVHCRESSYCRFGDCRNGRNHILVASRLMPGAALGVSRFTRGFVVEKGGPGSHAAILARMMSLPAVSGIPDTAVTLSTKGNILVDGDDGRVYIDPSEETLAAYRHQLQQKRRIKMQPAATAPVRGFRILADLDRMSDLPQVSAARAEGIGLYRTESEMLLNQHLFTEDEQEDRYSQLLDAAVSGPVYVRLLDLGADKAADWLDLPAEENPALGCRGARLLLERPELVRMQARALARASCKRRINVIYPMIHGVGQFLELRRIFSSAISDIPNAQLAHGVMFEVPGACLAANELFKHADFGRIGTNDLIQYLFAVDRMNDSIDRDELFEQPALWDLIANVAHAAAAAGKSLSMCGELVTNPAYIARILRAGISEISTHPRYIAPLRRTALRLLEKPESFCCSAGGQYSFLVV